MSPLKITDEERKAIQEKHKEAVKTVRDKQESYRIGIKTPEKKKES